MNPLSPALSGFDPSAPLPRKKRAGGATDLQGQKGAAFAAQNLPSCARLRRARTRTVHRTVLPSQGSIPLPLCHEKNAPAARFLWQGQKGSNPRHAVLETAALPAELYP